MLYQLPRCAASFTSTLKSPISYSPPDRNATIRCDHTKKGVSAMMKRVLALALVLCALLAACPVPAALASQYYSARTPITDASLAKRNNLSLAVEALNGITVPYDAEFSFNAAVGPRTKERGYQQAANGRGVLVTGGGVAQAASTLYLALLEIRGDIDIDPVKTYGGSFTDTYVTDPSQAIVTDYDADIDLSFTNREDDLFIEMWMSDSYVYCSVTVGEEADADAFWSTGDAAGSGPEGDAPEAGWFISAAPPERTLLASASLDCGGEANVLNNVELAADCVNDTMLESREVFSFNDVVGPRTKEYGYKSATNGRGVSVVGGGVAQVATALWLAIKDEPDFSVVEKSTYGDKYNQHYVSHSSDAILTDYNSGRDFSFRYTGSGSVTLYAYVSDGRLYCDIYEN